jgi:hypothetical protein
MRGDLIAVRGPLASLRELNLKPLDVPGQDRDDLRTLLRAVLARDLQGTLELGEGVRQAL